MSYAVSSSQFGAASSLQFSLKPAEFQGVFSSLTDWEERLNSFEQAIDRVKGGRLDAPLLREIEAITHTFIGGAEDLTSAATSARIEEQLKTLRGKIKEVNNRVLQSGTFLMRLSYYLDWDWLKKKSGAPQINTTRLVDNVRLDLNLRKIERQMQQLLFPAFAPDKWAASLESARSALEQQTKDFPVAAKFPRFQLYQAANGERHVLAARSGRLIDWKIELSSSPGLISLYDPKSGQRMECDPNLYDKVTKERVATDPKQLRHAFQLVCGEQVQEIQKKLPAAQARQNFADLYRDKGLYSLRELGLHDKGSMVSMLPEITHWAKGLCKGQAKSHFIVTNSDDPADPKSTFLLVSYDPGILKSGFTFQEVCFDDEGQEIISTLLPEKGGKVVTRIEDAPFGEVLEAAGAPIKQHLDTALHALQKERDLAKELLEQEKEKVEQLAKGWRGGSLDTQKAAFSSAKRHIQAALAHVEQVFKQAGVPVEGQILLHGMQRQLRLLEMRLQLIGQIEQFFIQAPQQKTVAEMERLYSPLMQEIRRLGTEVGPAEAEEIHALLQPVLIRDMIPLWLDEVETKMLPGLKAQLAAPDQGSRAKVERQHMMLSMQRDLAASWKESLPQSVQKERLEKTIEELDRVKSALEKTAGIHAGRDLYYQCTFNATPHGAVTQNGQSKRSLQKISLTAAAIGLGFMISSGAYYYGLSSSVTTSAALSLFGVGAVVAAQPYLPDSGEWQVLTQAGIHIGVGLAVMAGYRAYNPIPWHSPAGVVGSIGQAGAVVGSAVESVQATASKVTDFAWSFFANPAKSVIPAMPAVAAEAPFIGPQLVFAKPEMPAMSKWVRPARLVRPNPMPQQIKLPSRDAWGYRWRVLQTAIEVARTVEFAVRYVPTALAVGVAVVKG